jgi:hypothetical protein
MKKAFISSIAAISCALTVGLSALSAPYANAFEFAVYTGNDAVDYQTFEKWLGRSADGVLTYAGQDGNFDWQLMPQYLSGTKKHWYLSLAMVPDNAGSAGYAQAAAGQRNAVWTKWAQQIIAYENSIGRTSGPIYVRSTWELGGDWFVWTRDAAADPVAFKGAWKQFSQSFRNVSSRFKMVWDVAGDRGAVEQWYPGDDVIDVISQDIYWKPQYSSNDPVAAFNLYRDWPRGLNWIASFAAQHGKQVAISEFGTTGNTGGPFIEQVVSWAKAHNVLYATYWQSQAGGYDGLLNGRWPATDATFKKFFGVNGTARDGAPTTPAPSPTPSPVPPKPSPTPSPTPKPSPTPAPSPAPTSGATWTSCANEFGFCSFTGTRVVRYGANGSYVTKTLSNGTNCDNGVFGDPAFNVAKKCELQNIAPAPSPTPVQTYQHCADEWYTCSFSGTHTVRFGANGKYNYKTATGSIVCKVEVFGDPIPNIYKACDVLK